MTKDMRNDDTVIIELNREIEELFVKYNSRKDELSWADDDWEIIEIQEDLDNYAKEINRLKSRIREYRRAV